MSDSSQPVQVKRQAIIDCVGSGQLEQAAQLCQTLCREHPRDVEAWLLMAEIHARRGAINELVGSCQRVIGLQPDNAAAHYNLGVALQMQGRQGQAADHYRSVLHTMPDNIGALTNLALALRALGRQPEAIEVLEQALARQPGLVVALNSLGLCLRDLRELDKAEDAFKRALAAQPDSIEALSNLGLCLADQTRFEAAIELFRKALTLAPDAQEALTGLAFALTRSGQADVACDLLRDALARQPQNAQLHYALGNALRDAGRRQDAIDSYRAAARLAPAHHQALNNMGSLLQEAGQLREAEAAYRAALKAQPNEATVHFNLSTALAELGQAAEAAVHSRTAVQLRPDQRLFRQQFAKQIETCPPDRLDAAATAEILSTFRATGVDYQRLATPTLALLNKDPQFRKLRKWARDDSAAHLENRFHKREGTALTRNELLRALLMQTVICCADTERMLTRVRKALLALVTNRRRELSLDEIEFIAALACQCGNNEFVYVEDAEETAQVDTLMQTLVTRFDDTASSDDLESLQATLATVAMYRLLADVPQSDRLVALDSTSWPTTVRTLIDRQIRHRLKEREIRAHIPSLTRIRDGVSGRVREQYEESPYPRWLGVDLLEPEPYLRILRRAYPHFEPPQFTDSPIDILIAGCGTGKHAVLSKTRFADSNHLAIDLSTASLAYAQRRVDEFGLKDLKFMQADILELGDLEQRFHIIESVGVLHHLADPGAGLKVLSGLLHPGGLMNIGLYSALARRHISAARERFSNATEEINLDAIRRARREIMDLDAGDPVHQVSRNNDFFSLSDCRDLLFHVQEHCFNLPQIATLLAEHGLRFIGFELVDPQIKHRYRAQHPEDPDLTDLRRWATFERQYPDTFLGMYVLWCQKS